MDPRIRNRMFYSLLLLSVIGLRMLPRQGVPSTNAEQTAAQQAAQARALQKMLTTSPELTQIGKQVDSVRQVTPGAPHDKFTAAFQFVQNANTAFAHRHPGYSCSLQNIPLTRTQTAASGQTTVTYLHDADGHYGTGDLQLVLEHDGLHVARVVSPRPQSEYSFPYN